jgi:cysteine desulfurase
VHGLGLAVELAAAEQPQRHARVLARRERLLEGLQGLGARVHGDPVHHVGNTLNVAFPGCAGELVMMALDLEGIAVSGGSACHSGANKASHVIRAIYGSDDAYASVRFSLGRGTDAAQIARAVEATTMVVRRARAA